MPAHLEAILLTFLTFISTLLGGLFALRFQRFIPNILGFTAGVLVGLVSFDLLPEIFRLVSAEPSPNPIGPMVALVIGFLLFHIGERGILIHHAHEGEYARHKHPQVGVLSALALSGHSFLDGVGIGLGFQVSAAVGIIIAIAIIGHDFADGLNTVTFMLINGNTDRRSLFLLLVDAFAPVLGALSTLLFHIPNSLVPYYLGFFAGFLLYIGASDILPEAHSQRSTPSIIVLTIAGAAFAFLVTRAA
ncbi:MAG TPA: ZIP family metal transporter [Ktedonobacterales bacterium]